MKPKVLLGIVAVCVVIAVVLIYCPWCQKCPRTEERQTVASLVEKARQQQKEKKACDAMKTWKQVRDKTVDCPSDSAFKDWHQESQNNIALLEPRCKDQPPPGPTVPRGTTVIIEHPKRPEQKITSADLLKYYPVDRAVRSESILKIKGVGTNKDWGIRGEAHFIYFSRVPMQVRVTENDGAQLKVHIAFGTIDQTRIVSSRGFQLNLPDDPLLNVVFDRIDTVMSLSPVYGTIRKFAQASQIADPRLRRTLTWFGNKLNWKAGEDLQVTARIDKLSGGKFDVTYDPDFGVTSITPQGKIAAFTKSELVQLAYSLSLLTDYYIFPGANKKVGDTWKVRLQDVGSLIGLPSGTRTAGQINLKRQEPTAEAKKENLALLGAVDGDVTVTSSNYEHEEEGRLRISSGILRYSLQDLMVRSGELTFKVDHLWQSKDFLLFQAKRTRNLSVQAFYKARKIGPTSKSKK